MFTRNDTIVRGLRDSNWVIVFRMEEWNSDPAYQYSLLALALHADFRNSANAVIKVQQANVAIDADPTSPTYGRNIPVAWEDVTDDPANGQVARISITPNGMANIAVYHTKPALRVLAYGQQLANTHPEHFPLGQGLIYLNRITPTDQVLPRLILDNIGAGSPDSCITMCDCGCESGVESTL